MDVTVTEGVTSVVDFVLQLQSLPCDLDDDGDVDYDDFLLFFAAYGYGEGDPLYNADCDYDGDAFVGLGDYGIWYACYVDYVNGG